MSDMLIDPDCIFICPKCHDERKVTYMSVMNLKAFATKIRNEHRCHACGLQYNLSHAVFAMGGGGAQTSVHERAIMDSIYGG